MSCNGAVDHAYRSWRLPAQGGLLDISGPYLASYITNAPTLKVVFEIQVFSHARGARQNGTHVWSRTL